MFIRTDKGYVAVNRINEAVQTKDGVNLYLGGENVAHRATLSDWRAARRGALPMIPAAPGTMVLHEVSGAEGDDDDFYLMTCIGWVAGAAGEMVPLTIYGHEDGGGDLLGVMHPSGRVEIYHHDEFPTLDAYRENMRARRAALAARAQEGHKAA